MKSFFYLLVIFITATLSGNSQTLDDFEFMGEYYADELYLGFAVSSSHVTNNEAPYPEHHKLDGISGELTMRYMRAEKGEISWRWQHKLIGDMTIFMTEVAKGNTHLVERGENTGFSCGLLGWWNWTMNVHEPKKYMISVGANFHDYFLGSTYQVDSLPASSDRVSLEPQGYYFAIGPTIYGQYVLNKYVVLEAGVSYSIPFWRAVSLDYAIVDNDYPNPHFGQINIEAISKWGLYAGINYNWLINRGDLPNNVKRLDLTFGFRFRV